MSSLSDAAVIDSSGLSKGVTGEYACSACHRRKLKCDRVAPPRGCSTCRKSGIPCIYTDQHRDEVGRSTTRAGRKKLRGPYRKGQTLREKELENCVQLLTEKCSDLESRLQQGSSSLDSPKLDAYGVDHRRKVDSAGTILETPTDSHAHDTTVSQSCRQLGPAAVLELWLRYVSAVDPFTKLIHCSTVEQIVLSASHKPTSQSLEINALLLSIYLASLNSLEVSELRCDPNVAKEHLVLTYRATLDGLLLEIDADLNSINLTSLQAALIYLGSLRRQAGCDESLNISTLYDLIVRWAFRLSLHEPSLYSSLPPFEAEYRRRIWWTIRRYQSAYAEDFAKHNSLISITEIPLPSNYNDNDLEPFMTVYPVPRDGLSELSIVLIQFKVVQLLSRLNNPVSRTIGADSSVLLVAPEAMRLENQRLVDETVTEIEQEILSKCDASRRFDWLILLVSKVILTKVEMLLLESLHENDTSAVKDAYHDAKISLALNVIECHQIIATDKRLLEWQWYWKHSHQWHSTIYILEEVARRPQAAFAGRVWKVVNFVMTTPNILDKHGMDIQARTKLLDSHERALQAREQLIHNRQCELFVGSG